MSKIILTDIDECCFDWAGPFDSWVRENHPEHTPESHIRDHWHVEEWLGCDIDFSRDLIRRFNGDQAIWPNFKPLPEAQEVIGQLNEEGWKFVAITACATDYQIYKGRWDNLRNVFGDAFDALHCTGLHQSKAGFLARYRPTYWVEDKMNHALDGQSLGHTSFLIDYKHNAKFGDVDGITRVSGWREIYEKIHNPKPTLDSNKFPGNSI